jgi:hypothetical protein
MHLAPSQWQAELSGEISCDKECECAAEEKEPVKFLYLGKLYHPQKWSMVHFEP